jgi:hypothetical protein
MAGYLDSAMYQQMLAQTLQQGQPQSQYPAQAAANTGAQLINAFMLKQSVNAEKSKQADIAKALTSALQPDFNPVQVTPQVAVPGGQNPAGATPINDPARQAAYNAPTETAPNPQQIMARLLSSGNPDVQAQFAPMALEKALKAPEAPIKGTPGDTFFDPVTHQPIAGMSVPNAPVKPEATPDIIQIAQSLFPNDPKAQHDYMVKNSPSNLRAITNINQPKQNWQILTDPKNQTQYRYDLDNGKALTLDGQPYSPGGAGKISSGTVRSPASLAAMKFMEENPGATADDLKKFAADYGSTVKATSAFGAGKQGDLLRSFNVAISHLNTLDGLVDALGNGDIQALNKAGNYYAQQTGSPAPANFDAAKAIVGDEIIKAIVGGGGALADRENAQNQISRANSPEQLRGVIKTYKELMGGQLMGLKKQYTDTTGKNDFDSRLAPETIKELESRTSIGSKSAHPQDQQAIAWARSNPKDPRAAAILSANGVK